MSLNLTVVPLVGGTVSIGAAANPSTQTFEYFVTLGGGNGLDVGASAQVGYVNGGIEGSFENLNLAYGYASATFAYTPNFEEYRGMTIGIGTGFGFADTHTFTWTFPYEAADLSSPAGLQQYYMRHHGHR